MAKETQIGQLVIDLKMRLEGVEKGIETAKKKLQEIEEENKNLKNSNKDIETSFIAMSVVAVASLTKISGIIKNCVEEYKSYTQAMSSLSDVADYTNQNLDDLGNIMDKFGSYMTRADLATTIKNFSLMGFTAEQTEQMIEALTKSAIRNRNANYTVSEAVRVASEGYRQGLSTLSDSAGVTENLSVMLDKYAESIGKTAGKLTEAEQNQAYLTRTMEAAEPFANALSDYTESLAGKEGKYSQALRETQVAYTEALQPTLVKITEAKTKLIKLLGDLINSNSSATAGTTAFIGVLLTLGITLTAGMKIVQMYKKSIDALNISGKALKTTFASITIISGVVGIIEAVTAKTKQQEQAIIEAKEAQEKYNDVIKIYNDLVKERKGYTDEDVLKVNESINEFKEKIKEIENAINDYKVLIDSIGQYMSDNNNLDLGLWKQSFDMQEFENANRIYEKLSKNQKEIVDNYKNAIEQVKKLESVQENLNNAIDESNQYLEDADIIKKINNALDVSSIKTQQQEAAAMKNNVNQMQNYLNVVKSGNKNTKDYQEAVQALSKAYPEAVSSGILLENKIQDLINADGIKADSAWQSAQETINSYIEVINKATESAGVQQQVAQSVGKSWKEIAPSLQSVLSLLQAMSGYTPTDVPVTPVSTPKTYSGGSSYSNKRLDNYKKEIEHKKTMDQITLREEIAMYEKALRSYARTTDEKRELREKIYELNKELAKKEKDILDQQTEDYENYIQEQKNLRGAEYDINKQTTDYNSIIRMHKNYLDQIMKDERLSLDERKELYREELQVIRDYEQQKRDLRVEQIDNTVSQLTNAITKQLEAMQEKDKEMIDNNLKTIEEWKNARINAINEEYDARIEAINKELDALNKAEQQKTRDEEDEEYERKRLRLEDLIAFEHDATTKANYQKELDKLIAEYQKTLDKRNLEDRKEALNEERNLLKEEQDTKVQAVEDEVQKQKEVYDKQLDELEKYYDEQINMAQKTAENMLLNVEQNQDQIIQLLQSYGDAYEITGQTLGEKLAQGINEGLTTKIENIIARIQNTIDASIEAQLEKMASNVYKYEAGADKPQTTSVVINQTNNIEQNPEMPSEIYRKLNDISQSLAAEIAGL